MLGRVEAHINALRAQLNHKTTGVTPLSGDAGPFPRGEEGLNSSSAGGPRALGNPAEVAETTASGGGIDTPAIDVLEDKIVGVAPLPIETRGNYHLSPTPAERSGNEDRLTEVEDMRLNRLLRASSASASTPPPSGALTAPATGKRGFTNAGGSGNTDNKSGIRTMGEDNPGMSFNLSADTFGGICGASRELFGPSPTRIPGGSGESGFGALRRVAPCREEQEDDLEDISDGGFHSGCWKRKYVRGEMR